MLEEIEVTPRVFLEVVGLAERLALWAGVHGPTLSTDLQVEFRRGSFRFETLAHNCPRGREPQSKGKDFFGKHGSTSWEGGLPDFLPTINSTQNVEEPKKL
jgi:hypothetical protein